MRKFILSLVALMVFAAPALAEPYEFRADAKFTKKVKILGNLSVTGTQAFVGNQAVTGNFSVSGTSLHTGAVTNSSTLLQTGVATFTAAPVFTAGVPASGIQTGSAKRELVKALLSPTTGAAADTTTYAGIVAFGRAGIVKRVTAVAAVAPTVGTDTIEVLKNNTTTLISTATFDANTLVAYTAANVPLTATAGNLTLAATDVIRCKYNAGSQTVAAQDVEVIIEFEPTDF